MRLPWTICFIRHRNEVLLQFRRKPPNQGRWNGIGGSIEPGEIPTQCVIREVEEETGIRLPTVRFAGLVTWEGAKETGAAGMYAYVANLPLGTDPGALERLDLPDGWLAWLPVEHLDKEPEIVSNIPHFLPRMLAGEEPREYHCIYEGEELKLVERRPLTRDLSGVAE